ncbi:hypothetical protein DESC_610219 [Desulfosarcina cetonica]|nr:hypothetical protein DESC_610219 [Desulfosarcina cetonica]
MLALEILPGGIANPLHGHRPVGEEPIHAPGDFPKQGAGAVHKTGAHPLAQAVMAVEHALGGGQEVAGDPTPIRADGLPAETVHAQPGDGQQRRGRNGAKMIENGRVQAHQVIIVPGTAASQKHFQAAGQFTGRVLYFDHQVDAATVAFDHRCQGRNRGETPLENVQRHPGDRHGFPVEALGIRVVKNHRHLITCPAHVQFDAPDTAFDGRIKGRQGVLQAGAVVVFTAMGDDAAGAQTVGGRNRTRPAAQPFIDPAVKVGLDPFRGVKAGLGHAETKKNPLPCRRFTL